MANSNGSGPYFCCLHVAMMQVKTLTDEQKEIIKTLNHPNQMAPEDTQTFCVSCSSAWSAGLQERKVMYSAMDRKFDTPGNKIVF